MTAVDPDRLRTLIAILRENGVTYYEDDGVTMHLGATVPVAVQSQTTPEDVAAQRRRAMYGPIR